MKSAKFQIFKKASGFYVFTLTAANGVALMASFNYSTVANAERAIESVRRAVPDAVIEYDENINQKQ